MRENLIESNRLSVPLIKAQSDKTSLYPSLDLEKEPPSNYYNPEYVSDDSKKSSDGDDDEE